MQLTVAENPPVAVAGLLADDYPGADIITAIAEEDIPAGRVVVLGTGYVDGRPQAKLATGSTLGVMLGISKYSPTAGHRDPTTPGDFSTVPPLYRAGDVINVVRRGRVWADLVGSAVTAKGTKLNVRTTAGADKGKLTVTAADTNNVATGLVSGRPSVSTLIQVDINLPVNTP